MGEFQLGKARKCIYVPQYVVGNTKVIPYEYDGNGKATEGHKLYIIGIRRGDRA